MLENVKYIVITTMQRWSAVVQALAIGKPLDKMRSVPEAAVEGEGLLPAAHQLRELGFGIGEDQPHPDYGKVTRWLARYSLVL